MPEKRIGRRAADLALAMGAEATVYRRCATDTSRRLTLVKLEPLPIMRAAQAELEALSEESLGDLCQRIMAHARIAPRLGALAKWEGAESDELLEALQHAIAIVGGPDEPTVTGVVGETFPQRSARARRAVCRHALEAHRAATADEAIQHMLDAQLYLVMALTEGGRGQELADEAKCLRWLQVESMR